MFLYYAQAIESMMLTALSAIAMQQAKPTTMMLQNTKQSLHCASTNSEAMVMHHKSYMILAVHSDASFLSEPKACSRAGGHFFLSGNATFPPNNGTVHNTVQIIKSVMSSTTEAELGALYINTKQKAFLHQILLEMGNPQPPMPTKTDNSMTHGVVTKQNHPKSHQSNSYAFPLVMHL